MNMKGLFAQVYRQQIRLMNSSYLPRLAKELSVGGQGGPGEALRKRNSSDWLHVICGPLPMIESPEAAILARGVPSGQILSECLYHD